MTLAELLPSVGRSGQPVLEHGLWPSSTQLATGGELLVGGVALTWLARRFGTPFLVLDEVQTRTRARAFQDALPDAEVAFSAAALPRGEVFGWMAEEGLSLHVRHGELATALSVGVPAGRLLAEGVPALPEGLGRIVVGSSDIDRTAHAARHRQPVLLRVTAGVDVQVHRVLDHPRLRLDGLYAEVGSHVHRVTEYEVATRRSVGVIAWLRARTGAEVAELNLGGGFAAGFDVGGLAHRLRVALNYECDRHRVPVPRLTIEPGWSILANACVAVRRVVEVGRGVRVDGSLTGAGRVARLLGRHSSALRRPTTVVGMDRDVLLAEDIREGDLLAAPMTGPCSVRGCVIGVRDRRARLLEAGPGALASAVTVGASRAAVHGEPPGA